ncbi:vitamin B12 transport system substrate-binding protein [Serratia fonticola]|uniref:Vitamin B12 transport system substrate-binding protein n=1 Tax=Serratia fonticola TaxID=47917 RepID=A0A559T0N0_SERFO|nr:vitamin B12 ABC transporter substrate-binding protein BtuF [Serratia fonticola]TQI79351.1 vitamin B12 transport system substrate-binding protein [Serratia fonticola]TQI98624.1 vitamin B12 transport system substrate-binding protein [Serratia fonticola]TVZ68152.1 vitamin B12 transport system substrate-binding protein [Serratia fonticola]
MKPFLFAKISRYLLLVTCLLCSSPLWALRVVSLAPHTTEMVWAAGLGDALIAVSDYSDYPDAVQKLERVASGNSIKFERILLLKPDLVVASRETNPQRELEKLQKYGIQVVFVDPHSLETIPQDIERLARYGSNPETGARRAHEFRQKLAALSVQFARAEKIPAALLFGVSPLMTTNGQSIQNDVLRVCGVENVFAGSRVAWPVVSREQIISRQPRLLITGTHQEGDDQEMHFWRQRTGYSVINLNPDWFNRSGPRILLAAEDLCKKIKEGHF